ncbi:FAD-dependent oxidoreductase [Rhodococcus sp. 3Y1]
MSSSSQPYRADGSRTGAADCQGIRIVEGDVAGVSVGDGRLDGVELASGQVIPRSVVFVGPRFVPRGDLLTDLGCEADENGWVVTDPAGSTSVPGAWAAGMCRILRRS